MGIEIIEQKKVELKEELDKLKHEFKVELPKKIAEAREHGDLKENADYHAARERQGFVKAKIGQLNAQMQKLNSIKIDEIPNDKVGFGSNVIIKNMKTGETKDITFVTDAETNPSEGKITMSTPFGLALSNKGVGEEAVVTLPVGEEKYKIIKLITIHGKEIEVTE